jgi:hypothetical protein
VKATIVQAGWYWARRDYDEGTVSDWSPVWIHDVTGDGWEISMEGPVDRWHGEIGPMLAEQGPSQPVFRVEVSVPKMEAMIRDVALDALRTMADREPPMELLLAVWNDGYDRGSDGRLPTAYIDAEGGVRRVLEAWHGEEQVP